MDQQGSPTGRREPQSPALHLPQNWVPWIPQKAQTAMDNDSFVDNLWIRTYSKILNGGFPVRKVLVYHGLPEGKSYLIDVYSIVSMAMTREPRLIRCTYHLHRPFFSGLFFREYSLKRWPYIYIYIYMILT